MEGTISDRDEKIIEENAGYVLGMFELFHNDRDIINALYQKGIKYSLIPKILRRAKIPAYQKRVRQARRMIITGGMLCTLFCLIYLFFTNVPGSETFKHGKRDDAMLWYTFVMYRELFYFTGFIAVLQFIAGIIRYRKYSKLLKSNDDIPI